MMDLSDDDDDDDDVLLKLTRKIQAQDQEVRVN